MLKYFRFFWALAVQACLCTTSFVTLRLCILPTQWMPFFYAFYRIHRHYIPKVQVQWSRYRPGVTQRVWPYSFMTATLEGGEWSAARPGRTLPLGKNRYPFYRRLGGPQGRSGQAEILVPTGIRSRAFQPVVSRYTDWATRPHMYICVYPFEYIYICVYIYIYIYKLFSEHTVTTSVVLCSLSSQCNSSVFLSKNVLIFEHKRSAFSCNTFLLII